MAVIGKKGRCECGFDTVFVVATVCMFGSTRVAVAFHMRLRLRLRYLAPVAGTELLKLLLLLLLLLFADGCAVLWSQRHFFRNTQMSEKKEGWKLVNGATPRYCHGTEQEFKGWTSLEHLAWQALLQPR